MSERKYSKLLEHMIKASQSDKGVQVTESEAKLIIEKLVESAKILQQQNKRYKQALEEIDEEFETMLHYGFEGSDHLWRTRKMIEKALQGGNENE